MNNNNAHGVTSFFYIFCTCLKEYVSLTVLAAKMLGFLQGCDIYSVQSKKRHLWELRIRTAADDIIIHKSKEIDGVCYKISLLVKEKTKQIQM